MSISTRKQAQTLWHILFQFRGSIWSSVLPYCILNCLIMLGVELLAYLDIKLAFSPSGHGLMTLIVSFLVISKVNLTYERYMMARHAIGHGLAALRELNQAVLFYTQHISPNDNDNKAASEWRRVTLSKIIDLMDCTIRVIKDQEQSNYLARNVDVEYKTEDDPMLHVQALRFHIYTINMQIFGDNRNDESGRGLQLFERMRLIDVLDEFVANYRNLLKCASTPLPFQLIQMARTFLFLYTFTIPLVLRGVVEEIYSAIVFVFFLTYGFVGLELVAMKMMNPFGDGVNDLNVTGMKEATIIGMDKDMAMFGESTKLMDKRLEYSRQKPRAPSVAPTNTHFAGHSSITDLSEQGHSASGGVYLNMGS